MRWRPQGGKVQKYKKIRTIGRELNDQMFEIIPKHVLMRTAKDMNILHKGIFVLDSEEETSFIQDRMTYDVPWDGKNAVEHFEIEKGSELSAMEKTVLEGMKKAYLSLFEVLGNASRSSLLLSDLLSDSQIELTDISMSSTAQVGSLLAIRIIEVEDICMTSGALYPFRSEQKDILISGLKARQTARKGKKKRAVRHIDFNAPRNYSLYFFKQYKRISSVEVRMSEELFE